jgi:hypothetical protein
MAFNDSTQLQVVANGTVSVGTNPITAFTVGCSVVRVAGPPIAYTITLDPGVLGDGAVSSANAVRCIVTSLTALNNASVVKTTVGGNTPSVFTVTSTVGTTGAAADGAFDFTIYVAPGVP